MYIAPAYFSRAEFTWSGRPQRNQIRGGDGVHDAATVMGDTTTVHFINPIMSAWIVMVIALHICTEHPLCVRVFHGGVWVLYVITSQRGGRQAHVRRVAT